MKLLTTTIGAQLTRNAAQFKDREAVVYCESGERWTWQELNARANAVAKGFVALGATKGTHIAMWGTNVPEWLLTQMAAAKIGAVIVTINPEWKSEELHFALKQSDAEILCMIKGFTKHSARSDYYYDYLAILQSICPDLMLADASHPLMLQALPKLRHIVVVSETPEPGMHPWHELLELGAGISDDTISTLEDATSAQDTAMIQYTSGTTGFPKGTMLSHHNTYNDARAAMSNMDVTEADRLCGPVPYYHCFGSILINLGCLITGATMVIPAQHFNARRTLEAIEKEKCTVIYGVPTMFIAELEDPAFDQFDLSSLRTGIAAGAPVDNELMQNITLRMGARGMTIAYGLTETSPVTHQTMPDDPWEKRISTVGRPIEHTEAKIVDPNTLAELDDDEVGEIWVKGYNVMQGYYKNEEETEKTIIDGWLRSGDLGRRDKEGFYAIVGRLKEMIIVGGHNVYPAEVEQTLHTLLDDKVEILQVVGMPHPKLQEVVGLVVKCHPGIHLTLEEVKARCADRMEWPKIPRFFYEIDDFSPFMTVSGKIKKHKVRAFLLEQNELVTAH